MSQQVIPSQSNLDPEYQQFLEWKKFMRLQQQGIAVDDLTIPPLGEDNPSCAHKQQEEGLSMKGAIRSKEKCPKCHGSFTDTGKVLICPICLTIPKTYFIDLHYEGQRLKRSRDKEGNTLDSYSRAYRLLEHIRYEIDHKTFDMKFWRNADCKEFIFSAYIWKWFDRSSAKLAPSTRRKRKGFIKNYHLPFFGEKDIRTIRSGIIEDYFLSLPEVMSDKQKSNIINDLHKLFSDAKRREDITKLPEFPDIQFDTPMFQWIDRPTQEKVLEQINNYDRDIFRFIMLVGCRPGEARALMWDCIDLKQRIIYIKRAFSDAVLREKTKTGTWRVLPITDEIEEILKKQGRSISGFVFTNQCGRHYSAMIRDIWKEACKKIGLDINLYNGTRHSFGSQKLNEGFSLDEIGAVMGHSDAKMTKKYARILTENLKTVIEGKKVVSLKSRPSPKRPKGAENAYK